jgi:HEAT repeat protein
VAAIQALGRLGLGTLERLSDALQDPAAAVRIAAIEVLAWRDDPDVEAALDRMLEDPHPKVRDAVRKRRLTVISNEEST